MIYLVNCIWKYRNAINYNIIYNETIYKYPLKAFYDRTNKKKYKREILQHYIYYTNIFIIQNAILIVKIIENIQKKA